MKVSGAVATPIAVEHELGEDGRVVPLALRAAGERLGVLGIADRWDGESACYFKVRAVDGHRYLVKYDRVDGGWFVLVRFHADA